MSDGGKFRGARDCLHARSPAWLVKAPGFGMTPQFSSEIAPGSVRVLLSVSLFAGPQHPMSTKVNLRMEPIHG